MRFAKREIGSGQDAKKKVKCGFKRYFKRLLKFLQAAALKDILNDIK